MRQSIRINGPKIMSHVSNLLRQDNELVTAFQTLRQAREPLLSRRAGSSESGHCTVARWRLLLQASAPVNQIQ